MAIGYILEKIFYMLPIVVLALLVANKFKFKKVWIEHIAVNILSIFVILLGWIILALQAFIVYTGRKSMLDSDFGFNVLYPLLLFVVELTLLSLLKYFKLITLKAKTIFIYSISPALLSFLLVVLPYDIKVINYYRNQQNVITK